MTTTTSQARHTTTDRGFLAATVGGVVGGLLGFGLGLGAGGAWVELAGMTGLESLGPLILLGAAGIVTGQALGVWLALRRRGHVAAGATALLVVVAGAGSVLAVTAAGLGCVLLVLAPAGARWVVLRVADRSSSTGRGSAGPIAGPGRHRDG